MSIYQFLRILWAHRWLTVASTAATLVGAFIALLIVPPSYEAKTRVMLNLLRPDPVTGEVIANANSRTYMATQMELIKDYGVVGQAIDNLGWASNPQFVQQYQAAKNNDVDIRRWLSQRMISKIDVGAVPGTNILEITFRAESPGEAKAMADNLRNAYLDTALQTRRREATKTADWYAQQAAQEQAALNAADAAKTAFEKENGIVMQADNTDVETARLRALAGQGAVGAPMVAAAPPSAAAIELATLDSQISQAAQSLGPNHPQMQAMRARRGVLARVAAQDAQAQARAAAGAAGAGAGALEGAGRMQTSRVLAKRDKIERLNQLQAEVNLRREEYNKSMGRIAELRKEAGIADTGITAMGDAVMPQKPKFPNKPLILGGSLGLGLGLGLGLSLLVELFNRRIRGPEDLQSIFDVPLLAVIATRPTRLVDTARSSRPAAPRWPGRRRAVQA
ncbi:MAG TPA: Wzz/FepE/Etk N-terminal domain-containing protein [Phenylobacterium sp.]|nr:Wzz/FepE/Etk N-terminal domain-containing protein [Phenylobacterium sp.]